MSTTGIDSIFADLVSEHGLQTTAITRKSGPRSPFAKWLNTNLQAKLNEDGETVAVFFLLVDSDPVSHGLVNEFRNKTTTKLNPAAKKLMLVSAISARTNLSTVAQERQVQVERIAKQTKFAAVSQDGKAGILGVWTPDSPKADFPLTIAE